jgi:hypothetical protein
MEGMLKVRLLISNIFFYIFYLKKLWY